MKPEQKTRRKQLLKDPLTAFKNEATDIDQGQIDTLNALWQQYCATKAKIKAIKNRQGLISKEFGEAKRQGKSTERLKQQMLQHSSTLKALSDELQGMEEKILNFFEFRETREDTQQPIAEKPHARRYNDSQFNDEDIVISTLGSAQTEWNAYVEQHPAASIYHRVEWRDVIYRTFGHTGSYLYAKDPKGNIVGILPLIRLRSWLFGDYMVSMPYFNYGGAVADHPGIEQKLLATANEQAAKRGVSHIEYRDDIERPDYPARTDKVNMILALPEDKNTLWNNFTPKLRAQIKRPQRESPDILHGGNELLQDFYAVFARNMRDLGTPVYSKSFFANILKTFPQQSSIVVLCIRERPVAAAFLIGHRDTLEIPWASTIKEVNHLSMNMLLYWEVLQFAIDRQYQHFDFGRSSKGCGTYRFKQQWGAVPKPLFWHYWLTDKNDIPSLNPSNPKYAMVINMWKRLPVSLTKWIGPWIVRNLP